MASDDKADQVPKFIAFSGFGVAALLFGLFGLVNRDLHTLHLALSAAVLSGYFAYGATLGRPSGLVLGATLAVALTSLGYGLYLFASGSAALDGLDATWIDLVIALVVIGALVVEFARRRRGPLA